MASDKTLALLRSRLCNPYFVHSAFKSSANSSYSKLKFVISNSISEACDSSVLLLGPRGCGKSAVFGEELTHFEEPEFFLLDHPISAVDLVLGDLRAEHPDMISVEFARQLCLEHQLLFSKMGKQWLLYSLLDALQTLASQDVVIGVRCRLDADQLLKKRVRSRFSHRKLLFVPPTTEDIVRLLERLLFLPKDQSFPSNYITEFNSTLQKILGEKRFKEILNSLSNVDGTISNLLSFRVVSYIDPESGLLSLNNFKSALLSTQRQPKLENPHEVSILELYKLVCMNRLEIKEQNSYNFISIMKGWSLIYFSINLYKMLIRCPTIMHSVCLRAFEHLLERELISFSDPRAQSQSIEFHPVKLLSPRELHKGLKSNSSCPTSCTNVIQNPKYVSLKATFSSVNDNHLFAPLVPIVRKCVWPPSVWHRIVRCVTNTE